MSGEAVVSHEHEPEHKVCRACRQPWPKDQDKCGCGGEATIFVSRSQVGVIPTDDSRSNIIPL
jgi:hypothetical protein